MVMILDDILEIVMLSEGEQQCCRAAFYFTFATNSTVVLLQPRPNLSLVAVVLKLRTALRRIGVLYVAIWVAMVSLLFCWFVNFYVRQLME
jgi:hypothetical protein